MPPFWWWLLVLGTIAVFMYLLKGIFKFEEQEIVTLNDEVLMRRRLAKLKLYEIIAWTFVPIGMLVYVYGVTNSSPFIIYFLGSCLVIAGYVFATYFRRQRSPALDET